MRKTKNVLFNDNLMLSKYLSLIFRGVKTWYILSASGYHPSEMGVCWMCETNQILVGQEVHQCPCLENVTFLVDERQLAAAFNSNSLWRYGVSYTNDISWYIVKQINFTCVFCVVKELKLSKQVDICIYYTRVYN